eukprot:TRINITY_DN15279_c0_g1_i1.p1 TRINITY_DN15279_c0_g1~~TRINITY_DN15279_c0_g1_i1.p1  ORF type:complete len:702 (+),score=105.26 TRINITY_DN15279_c0_g1_i1:94-2199(+)
MRRGGKKALKSTPSAPPIHTEFWNGSGVSLKVPAGSAAGGRTARVGAKTFKELKVEPGQNVVVHEAGNPESARVYELLPSNKVDKGILTCGHFEGKGVLMRAVPENGISATEVFAATASFIIENNNPPPTGIPLHVLQSLIKDDLQGKVLTTTSTPHTIVLRILGISTSFAITPLNKSQTSETYTWIGPKTRICIIEPPTEASVSDCSEIQLLNKHLPVGRADSSKPIGVLVTGASGVGKSYFAETVRIQSGWPVIKITTSSLQDDPALTKVSDQVTIYQNSSNYIVWLDSFEDLFKPPETGTISASSSSSVLENFLCTLLDTDSQHKCLVIACACTSSQLPESLTRNGRLDITVELEAPSCTEERRELIRSISQANNYPRIADLERVAMVTNGYSASDYTALVSAAKVHGGGLSQNIKRVRPSALRTIEVSIPTVRWTDVGGQEEAKQLLKECVEWPLLYSSLFAKMDIKPPRGILLFGPPGCSKTLLAKALATECTYNFIAVKGPELYNKWVGESEKAVRDVFAKARSAAPCIIFFDEIDGMCGKRGGGGVTDRVISQFLTEMDGLPTHKATQSNQQVIVLAATNRPDNLDIALLRPGRIDRKVYIGLPDSDTREQILAISLRGIPTASDVSLPALADELAGRSGAEVVAAVKEAVLCCLSSPSDDPRLSMEHLLFGASKVQPRTSQADLEFFKKWGST